ncbi:alkaline phosphatase D family protein [Nocardioides nanhaiensis]|uniref:alkaline phosphatase D family protein n=1 Tax=Nocardioides nanhaiensis TaxID=1476871 RepID=UPI0031ED6722
MQTSRRALLSAAGAGGLVAGALAGTHPTHAAAPVRRDLRRHAAARLPRSPFTLGVASGDPAPDGFVVWTRLATDPLADDGLGGMPSVRVPVRWEVARDERFRRVVARGTAHAGPESAHAVHVTLRHLEPGREYFYRFAVQRWVSPTGRALTTPRPDQRPASLSMAFASCSNYPAGYFTAYRHLAEERPDLVLHLGDFQYEQAAAANAIGRPHVGPETVTLANYRQRLAQYRTDPDLQAAQAAAPWLVVWDDHEVDNNYADDVPERVAETPGFLDRRAAAYRAYYENMPLRATSVPRGPDLQLYRRVQWGSLATFHMLDTRQHRSDQACGDGFKSCPDADDPSRSLLGAEQERWLADGFARSRARWDLLGQQVFFGRRDNDPGAATTVSMDAWDGYAATRRRVVESWESGRVRNPVVLTGDVHAHWASEVLADWADGDSRVLGSELVTSSITSGGNGYDEPTGTHPWAAWNPNLRFWTNLRGYVRTTITPASLRADFRCVREVTTPGAEVFTRRSYELRDGERGLRQVADSPLPSASLSVRRLPDEEQIIRDTIREETGY